jgi:hypothetical protein
VQTTLPNGVAPSCWSTVPSAVSEVSGAGAFVRAVCRACAHPTQFVVQSIFVVHPRSECRSRNSPLRSQAVYRELQRPYPAVPREAVFAALDAWWKPLSSGWTARGVRAVVVFDSRRNPLKRRRMMPGARVKLAEATAKLVAAVVAVADSDMHEIFPDVWSGSRSARTWTRR